MYKPMQTHNRSFIKSSCSYLAILSCFVCLPLPVYAYYTSGSCKACSTGCSSGYTSTKPSSSQCYTNSSSYFSCSSASDVTCYKNANICSSTTYPYTSKSNATMSGACTGYRSTAGGACSGSSTTYYKSFTCDTNYCLSGSACYRYYSSCSAYNSSYRASDGRCGSTKYASTVRNSSCGYHTCYTGGYTVCSATTYPYTSITNATMSTTKCTGRRGTVGGSCTTSSNATYYSGYSCNSGYCGTNCTTSCSSSCPTGYDYTSVASGKCYTGSKSYTNCSSCSSTNCYAIANVCNSTTYPYTEKSNATMSGACTGYRSTSGGACSGTSTTYYKSFTCDTNYCLSGSDCYRYYSSCSAYSSSLRATDGRCGSTIVDSTVRNSSCGFHVCYSRGYTVCSASTYPYTSSTLPDNAADVSGNSCTGRRGTVGGACTTSSDATYYSSFTCSANYCKYSSACYTVCPVATYTYTSSTLPDNSSGTGSCTGRRGTSGGTCTTTSNATYYSDFTCDTGYVKVGSKCEPTYTSCEDAGYWPDEDGMCCSSADIYLTDGTTTTCYDSCVNHCSSASYPYTSSTLPNNSTGTGSCTGYRTCSSTSSGTYYSGFTCKSGYCKSGSTCYKYCSTSSYPYYSGNKPSNSTLSGSTCTGRRAASSSSCSTTTSSTNYASFTCNSGYVKSGNSCVKSSGSDTAYQQCADTCNSEYDSCIGGGANYYQCSANLETCMDACESAYGDASDILKTPVQVATISEEQCRKKYLANIDFETNDDFAVYGIMS